jgi:hypothetical protein
LTTRGRAREALPVMPVGGAEDCRCGCRDQGYEDLGYHGRPPSVFWPLFGLPRSVLAGGDGDHKGAIYTG